MIPIVPAIYWYLLGTEDGDTSRWSQIKCRLFFFRKEEALCKQAINKRNRSRLRQLDAAVERRTLGEIQNVGEGTSAQGPWQAAESSQGALGEQGQSGPPGGRSQRRERHNRMERDRR